VGYVCRYAPLPLGSEDHDVDCVDQRDFSEGQVRTRLQAFMEMLGERQPVAEAH
jgi:hypothetical protein